jgi:hypothetical protein
VIAGEVFDEAEVECIAGEFNPAGVSVVSLVERFGERRARDDVLACIRQVVEADLEERA